MSKKTLSPLRRAAQNKARKYREDHKTSQSDIPLGILSFVFAGVAGVAGAIAFPVLWGTNFGVGITMALTGAACGVVTGFIIPQAIHKVVASNAFQYLKPSIYQEARTLKKAEQTTAPAPKR